MEPGGLDSPPGPRGCPGVETVNDAELRQHIQVLPDRRLRDAQVLRQRRDRDLLRRACGHLVDEAAESGRSVKFLTRPARESNAWPVVKMFDEPVRMY